VSVVFGGGGSVFGLPAEAEHHMSAQREEATAWSACTSPRRGAWVTCGDSLWQRALPDFRLQPFVLRGEGRPGDKALKDEIQGAAPSTGVQASAFYPAGSGAWSADRSTSRSPKREQFTACRP